MPERSRFLCPQGVSVLDAPQIFVDVHIERKFTNVYSLVAVSSLLLLHTGAASERVGISDGATDDVCGCCYGKCFFHPMFW